MRLVLLRHAHTQLNELGHYQGQCDPPLSHAGVVAARDAAESLAGVAWVQMACSPQLRAQQTVNELRAGMAADVPLTTLDGLRERHLGTVDALCQRCAEATHPGLRARLVNDQTFQPPGGGESLDAVRARVSAELAKFSAQAQGPAVVITHGGVINALTRQETGASTEPLHAVIADLNKGDGLSEPLAVNVAPQHIPDVLRQL